MKDSDPAFPSHGTMGEVNHHGMTLRQYAAIHLCVPDSGEEWLDEMIRKAQRDRVAEKVTQAILSSPQMFAEFCREGKKEDR